MPHNEITRVQVPALMHLAKLGYDFIPTNSKPNLDTATNILIDSFTQAFERLNPTKNAQDSLEEIQKSVLNEFNLKDTDCPKSPKDTPHRRPFNFVLLSKKALLYPKIRH
ncbi:hypothetical protein VN0448_03150 [Helicobacter pylori]|nr:hypothetical protein VN0448_03150 [Helicobacter pylori]